MKLRGSAAVILSGFTLAVLPFVLLMILAIAGLLQMRDDMEKVIRQHHERTELTYVMRTTARERTITLYQYISSSDPFEKAAVRERHIALADEFLQTREKMQRSSLGGEEAALFREALQLLKQSVQIQAELIEISENGTSPVALERFSTELVPLQNQIFDRFRHMLDIQNKTMNLAMDKARSQGNLILLVLMVSGLAAIALSFFNIRRSVLRSRVIEDKLFAEKERAQVTLHSITDGVITSDLYGNVDSINEAAERLIGWQREMVVGKRLREVYTLYDALTGDALNCIGCHELMGDPADKPYYLIKGRNGRECIIQDSVGPIYDREGDIIGAVVVFRDVSHAWRRAGQLSWRASHDMLTGLANRAEFERQLEHLVRETHLDGGQHALMFMDLDRFKIVNDSCGHAAGDELLRQVAGVISAMGRDTDIVARVGGDEFAVLVPDCPMEQAIRLADDIRRGVEAIRFHWQGQTFEIGLSVGLAEVANHSGDVAAVLSHADDACSRAKAQGRNRVLVWCADDVGDVAGQNWKAMLTHALEHDGFELYFQEIRSLADKGPSRYIEILLRMNDDNGGVMLPAVFLSSAERYGFMAEVDRWVLRNLLTNWGASLRQAWEASTRQGSDFVCAVNISVASLNEEGFVHYVEAMIEKVQMPPQALCFEIKENAVISHFSRASSFIRRLSGLGCRFAIDDACGMLSSFNGYKNLSVDYIKIDPAMVRESVNNPINRATVEAMARIARLVGIRSVAKGIETSEVLSVMKEVDVDCVQGYALHVPEAIEGLRL
ncbi:MAG: EAL domain-containing protein [Sulfuricellaceae bacterium]|nr:EAL domain-containing protein [Sulfuricellaceae bacterium]